jgi:excisionase family DNA binding protein
MSRHPFAEAAAELFDALGKFMVAVGQEYADRHVAAAGLESPAASPQLTLISKKELAERLGVSTRTIDSWISSGRIRYLKIGRAVRFSFDDVASHLKD